MIYMFRKEMRKWQNVLWIVLASMVLGTLSGVMFGPKRSSDAHVAKVNGYPITFDQYRKALLEIQERINSIRQMAKAYGMSEEVFLQAYGFDNPQALALDNCVQEKLYDCVKDQLSMRVDQQWFAQELVKSMPHLVDAAGRVNISAYHDYLQRLSMTPAEFEARRAEEIKRDMLLKFVQHTAYVPLFIAKEAAVRALASRSFSVVTCKIDHFIPAAQNLAADEKELNAFFLSHKDQYRELERRSGTYWEINTKAFVDAVDIDNSMAMQFYEKHKAALYRIPPKVKVRRLLMKSVNNGLPPTATDVLKQAKDKPGQFAALVKQYSASDTDVKNGGIIDFFDKGTHDPEFEKAAFRLKETGEISPIIKTKVGYEILQLVERLNAGEKSFDSVKSDIIASMRAKRAMNELRAELEQTVRMSKSDAKSIDVFVAKYRLSAHRTEMLTEADAKGSGVESLLAKKLFAAQSKTSVSGYFVHDDRYILYQLDEVKKSYIPVFAEVKAGVAKDFIKSQANVIAKRTIKEMRAAVLAGKKSLSEVAAELKASYLKTEMITKSSELKEFGNERGFKEKLLGLTDSAHVLFFAHDSNFYLAKIESMKQPEKACFDQEIAKYAKLEQAKIGSLQTGAFIASLHRNAKIEVENKNMLEMQPVKE